MCASIFLNCSRNSVAWSSGYKYTFDSDPLGGTPTGSDLTVIEPSGSGYVQVASQGGRNCCQIAKTGGDDRVRIVDNLTDNVSVGVIHCMIWHDDSAFGLNLAAPDNTYLIDMVWWGGDITSKPYGDYLANYTLNQWIEVIIYYNLTQGWMFSLDGHLYGVNYSIPLSNPYTGNATQMIWSSFFSAGGNGNMFVDNIGYDFAGNEPIPTVGDAYPFTRPSTDNQN
ncbi:MAG TPA: hypothetical protein VKK79_18320, partial [Candidatus Lokiarchaeia archaeon]|nr:hypothetical protein [Candidatus Lokiarchaeia archaeon]